LAKHIDFTYFTLNEFDITMKNLAITTNIWNITPYKLASEWENELRTSEGFFMTALEMAA